MNSSNKIILTENKKVYFISDLHLGLKPKEFSDEREKRVVRWLDSIKADAQVLFLLGDVFDYWFEYKRVAPQGFVRFLGKLAELADSGVEIHFFTGNHDLWLFNYLKNEIGLTVHKKPLIAQINTKSFYMGHGDGQGPGDFGYKFMKYFFQNPILQKLFAWLLHPDFATWIGHNWSNKRRKRKGIKEPFLGEKKEYQILFAQETLKKEHFDYFIFGHRHISMDIKLNDNCRYINLGEWIRNSNYGVFDGNNLFLNQFQ